MINERLLEIRKKLGLTQGEFGKYFDLKQTAISQYEKGINELKSGFLETLSKDFNINIQWLITGEGEMFINSNIANNDKEVAKKIIESITNELKKIDDNKVLDYINDEIRVFIKRQKMKKEDGVILNLI